MRTGDKYSRKGKVYVFISFGESKHPDTGVWYNAASYMDEKGFYTCTLERWKEEFKLHISN